MGNLKQELKSIPKEVLDTIVQVIEDHEKDSVEDMRAIGIIHTTDALLEAKLPDEKIISLLQKHWDLRRSEAEMEIKQAKNRLAKK